MFTPAPGMARTARGAFEVLLVLSAALLPLGCSESVGVDGDVAAVAEQIQTLRARGASLQAAALTQRLLEDGAWVDRLRTGQQIEFRALNSTLTDMARLPEESQRRLAEADRLTAVIDAHEDAWDYSSAIDIACRQLEMRLDQLGPVHGEIASSLCRLGGLLHDQGDYVQAEPTLDHALRQARAALGEEHPLVARSYFHLGKVLKNTGRFEASRQAYDHALDIYQRAYGATHPEIADVLVKVGELLRNRHREEEAEQLYRRALEMRERWFGAESIEIVPTLCILSFLLETEGRLVEAERCLHRAYAIISMHRGPDHPDYQWVVGSLSGYSIAAGDGNLAERFAAWSDDLTDLKRQLTHAGYNRRRNSNARMSLIRAQLYSGQSTDAWRTYDRGLGQMASEFLLMTDPERMSQAEIARAHALRDTIAVAARNLGRLEQHAGEDPSFNLLVEVERSRCRLLRAKLAWTQLEQEISARQDFGGYSLSIDRVQSALDEHAAIIGWIEIGYADRRAHARRTVIGYVLRSTGPVRMVPIHDGEVSAGSPLASRRHLDRLLHAAGRWPAEVANDPELRGRAHEVWQGFVAPLMPHLEDVEHLIACWPFGYPLEVLEDTGGHQMIDRFLISYAPSASIFARLRERTEARSASHEAAWPDATEAGHPASHGGCSPETPMTALFIGDPPFSNAHRQEMRQQDETIELAMGSSVASAPYPGAAVLRSALRGDRAALAQLPRLPLSRQEVRSAAACLPGSTVLVGEEASEESLWQLMQAGTLRGFDIIHFATHTATHRYLPERSALILSQVALPEARQGHDGTDRTDGLVTAEEILWGWNLDTELIVLSGCETAASAVNGRKLVALGFPQAFIAAGARCLLTTLWRVEDRATALLMARFYENWSGTYDDERLGRRGEAMSKVAALREAKIWLRDYADATGRQPYRHPTYWSAFVLHGDPGPRSATTSSPADIQIFE